MSRLEADGITRVVTAGIDNLMNTELITWPGSSQLQPLVCSKTD